MMKPSIKNTNNVLLFSFEGITARKIGGSIPSEATVILSLFAEN